MIIVGLTGTIGTGKSTVAKLFADMGAFIVDADLLARQVVEPGRKAWREVVEYFGTGILNDDYTINRQTLADIVFNDSEKLDKLNEIIHPEILAEDKQLINEIRRRNPNCIVIKDIPLLLESGPELARELVDKIIVVYTSPELQIKRLIERGMDMKDARKRIENQIPVNEKLKYADFVINNDGDVNNTFIQVRDIYAKLLQLDK
jgi:dephospho-CoA kinase